MDQEKDTNSIAEIFDEMFTLLEDLERRSVAMLEYLKEQGANDEKLAPYLDQAAAASNVRWRAARARMEHLLAPKPKSTTEAGKDEKANPGAQDKQKESESGGAKARQEKDQREQGTKSESKEAGEELASAQAGTAESGKGKDGKSQNVKSVGDAKAQEKEQGNPKQDVSAKQDKDAKLGKEAKENSGDAGAQASAASAGKQIENR
jgi:hypothetical protein